MNVRRNALLAALVLVGMVLAAAPGQGTHTAEYNSANPIPTGGVDGHTYERLTIRDQTSGTLHNATINATLKVVNSGGSVTVKKSRVGTSLLFENAPIRLENNTVTGTFYLNQTSGTTFYYDTYQSQVRITNSHDIRFYGSTFQAGACADSSTNITFQNVPNPPPLPACTSGTTTSPPPTPTTTGATATTVYPSPYPYPTKTVPPPTTEQPIEIVGRDIPGDVHLEFRDRVVVRDSTIHGNLFIRWSPTITLTNVRVTGDVHVDQGFNLQASSLDVDGSLGFSGTSNFKVLGANVGGFLGCYKCAQGTFENVNVAGEVQIVDSFDVRQVNVKARASTTLGDKPLPTPGTGVILLNLDDANSKLAFSYEKRVGPDVTTDVKLEMEAITGRARFEASSPKDPQKVGIQLESRFEKVREFEDRDGNGAYDMSDLVVREFLVDELKVQSIQQEPLEDGGWIGRIDYELPPGGTMSLIFTAKDADPDHTKIDVEFRGYRYTTRDSQLALQVRLESAYDWQIDRLQEEDRLTFLGEGYNGYFSWVHTAEVDGRNRPVTARVLEEHKTEGGSREIVLYLGYARGDHIFHDPSIGLFEAALEDLAIPLGNVLVYGTTIVAVLVVLWALGQSSRRRLT